MSSPPRGSYRSNILKDYSLVFPDILQRISSHEIQVSEAKVRRKFLRDFDPVMFVPDFQRFCSQQPTILATKDEETKAREAGQDVMIWPLYGEGVPRAYVCNHSSKPNVGLKVNTWLSNRDEYPRLPCCFGTSQTDPNKPSLRYEYEHPDEVPEQKSEKGRPKMFLSQKIMKRDAYGYLPTDISRFLIALDSESIPVQEARVPFVRQGTLQSINSVLDALIKAMLDYYEDIEAEKDDETIIRTKEQNQAQYRDLIVENFPILSEAFKQYEGLTPETRAEYLGKVRAALADLLPTNITAQSAYATDLKAMADHLTRNDGYLDPKIVWRLLEEVFRCSIILFRRTEGQPNGFLSAPQFLQDYLQYRRSRKANQSRFTVLLFETTGGERDRLAYPQVEIIKNFRFEQGEDDELLTIIFSWFNPTKDKELLGRLDHIFNMMYGYDGHSAVAIPNAFKSKPIGQCADFYGKIRLLQFGDGLCILTEPLPPLDRTDLEANPQPQCSLSPVPIEKAKGFLAIEDMKENKDYRVVRVGNRVVGYQCWKRTRNAAKPLVRFYIPIQPIAMPFGTIPPATLTAPAFINKSSLMEGFNRLARLARYLIEYTLWIFSFWNRDQRAGLTESYLTNFATDRFRIVKGHKYPEKIPRRLDKSLPGVLDGERILVPTVEARNRLVYALQIRLGQNEEDVMNYMTRIYIKDYYQDITDFNMQETSVVLFGTDMVKSWILSKLPHYVLYDRIRYAPCDETDEDKSTEQGDGVETKEQSECRIREDKGFVLDPYFMRLETLDEKIYIVQQAKSLPQALYIADIWNKMGFNVGYATEGLISPSIPFRFVAYDGPLNLEVSDVNGKSTGLIPTVLQYRFKDEIFTMALLPYMNDK